jgi:CHAT domain-containing protein
VTAPRWVLAAALAAATGSHSFTDARELTPLQPVDRSAVLHEDATIEESTALGKSHGYEVGLTAGDFFEISVSQDYVVVSLSLRSPDGAVVRAAHIPGIFPIAQRLLVVAPVSGRYLLKVKVDVEPLLKVRLEPRKNTARYTLHVIALRPATSEDRVRVGWFEVLGRAVKLEYLRTMDGLRQAIPVYREAAAGWRALGDDALEAMTLEALAVMTGYFPQFRAETALVRERLTELYTRLGERELQTMNWSYLSLQYYDEGRLREAKQAAARTLDLAIEQGFRVTAARTERELGLFEIALGNYDRARELAQQAQDLAAAIPDRAIEASALSDLGRLDDLAGDLEAAVARNRRALELASGDASATAPIMLSLGFNHLRRGELDEAEARFESRLALAPTFVRRDQEALTRLGLGEVHLARGDREGARRLFEAAASELEKGAQRLRCIAEQRLGRMDLENGRLDEASARFETMVEIAARQQYAPCESEGRAGLADIAARRDDLETAEAEARRVVQLTETFREAAVSLESRSLGFGTLAPAYERAIDISMRRAAQGDRGAVSRALTLNEQALARGLLDRVSEAHLEARARVPAALAIEHQQVRERWRARLAELQVALRTRPDAPQTKALIDETRTLEVRVRDSEARIDAADTRLGSFARPRPLGVEAIQRLLDEDTMLLEYALGETRSYLWVVSSRDMRAFTLAPRAEIEALARRVHEGLARSPATAKVLDSSRSADEEDRRTLTRLVIEPAASLLAAKRLVLEVPGALSLIPFGALPQPGAGPDAAPMLARHEIVQVPSATILGAMRNLTASRAKPTRTAAVFADPIFDEQDPRVRARATSSPVRRDPLDPARLRGVSLTRLPFSRGEAEAIAKLAPGNVNTFLGLDATRERALARALFDYRFIHFATHGIVNQDVSSLSSLVLSLVDRSGRARDGFVMVPDIYDMTLNADVVVLSGCQTALGKQIRGEGPIGLARAFMFAGVPRVVASLWPVDDLATAELMKRFYRGMLVDRLAPAAALRRAQQQLAASRRWASPYFWAPFVLQGDWR